MDYQMLVIGIAIGIMMSVLGMMIRKKEGLLRIHWDEDENKPYLFVELNDVPEKLIHRKYVVFRVKEDARQ